MVCFCVKNVDGVVIRGVVNTSDEACEKAGMRAIPILSALLYFSTSSYSLHENVGVVPVENIVMPSASSCFFELSLPKNLPSYDIFRERMLKAISAYDHFDLL